MYYYIKKKYKKSSSRNRKHRYERDGLTEDRVYARTTVINKSSTTPTFCSHVCTQESSSICYIMYALILIVAYTYQDPHLYFITFTGTYAILYNCKVDK